MRNTKTLWQGKTILAAPQKITSKKNIYLHKSSTNMSYRLVGPKQTLIGWVTLKRQHKHIHKTSLYGAFNKYYQYGQSIHDQ